jgi:hypothetical protein
MHGFCHDKHSSCRSHLHSGRDPSDRQVRVYDLLTSSKSLCMVDSTKGRRLPDLYQRPGNVGASPAALGLPQCNLQCKKGIWLGIGRVKVSTSRSSRL